MLGEPSTEPFSRPTEFAPRNAVGGGRPETFTMAKDPKANAVGEKYFSATKKFDSSTNLRIVQKKQVLCRKKYVIF